jgi:hypothetical protein
LGKKTLISAQNLENKGPVLVIIVLTHMCL